MGEGPAGKRTRQDIAPSVADWCFGHDNGICNSLNRTKLNPSKMVSYCAVSLLLRVVLRHLQTNLT